MEGRARAPAAGTVLNALATGIGSAFAIDLETRAIVELHRETGVSGRIAHDDAADTALIERCVERTLAEYGDGALRGGTVRTESEVPIAGGLKSSSAAANATVLATLDALDRDDVDPVAATRIGVEAARDAGVTATGAFDDASASMLGGVTITDNSEDRLLSHDAFDRSVAIYTPPERAYSADADIEACERIGLVAEVVADLAREGAYGKAMTINGFAFSAALEFSPAPMLDVLPAVEGVSLSGTGPSTVAIGSEEAIARAASRWDERPGVVRVTETDAEGGKIT